MAKFDLYIWNRLCCNCSGWWLSPQVAYSMYVGFFKQDTEINLLLMCRSAPYIAAPPPSVCEFRCEWVGGFVKHFALFLI